MGLSQAIRVPQDFPESELVWRMCLFVAREIINATTKHYTWFSYINEVEYKVEFDTTHDEYHLLCNDILSYSFTSKQIKGINFETFFEPIIHK